MRAEDRYVKKDAHRQWMQNIARLVWVTDSITDRRIVAGTMFEARDLAVECYVRLRNITGNGLEVMDGVYATPDYEMDAENRCYVMVMKLSLYGSSPQRIRSVAMTEDALCISTERFYIQFPIQLTETEKDDLDRFRKLVADRDPLRGGDFAT